MLWQNFKMALRSVMSAKVRSFLTLLGMVIGIGSVITVLAIGEGVKNSVSEEVNKFGADLIQISSGNGIEDGNFAASFGTSTLTLEDLESVQNLDSVENATALMIVSGVPQNGNKSVEQALIMGATPEYDDTVDQPKIGQGEFITEEAEGEKQAVVGQKVAEELFGKKKAVGETFTLRNQEFEVAGVYEKQEQSLLSAGMNADTMVTISLEQAAAFNNGNTNIIEIDAAAKSTDNLEGTKKAIEEVLLENHDGVDDFSVITSEEGLDLFNNIFSVVTGFVAAIAAIALVVGGIGIMNIMLVSVSERTREIGIRRAIGATRGNILSQFLIEAMVLSLLGGVLGVALAYGAANLAGIFIDITPVFTLFALGLAVGVSVLIGIVFGIAPAIKASRKDPIESLRHE